MSPPAYRFGRFRLDPAQRSLSQDGRPVALSGRYFDALVLLVAEAGQLIGKDRFNDEVWRGAPVSDEALTQCVRALRRALGDKAADPRFIATVPGHGYRFIADVTADEVEPVPPPLPFPPAGSPSRPVLAIAGSAALGGALAGLVGGGGGAALGLVSGGLGAASTLVALSGLCLFVGALGGAAVGLGLALGGPGWRGVAGAAAGGLAVGLLSGIVGGDLFMLLFGKAPLAFTGALDAGPLGLATGLGVMLARRWRSVDPWLRLAPATGLGAAAGALVALAGGRLMTGSLVALVAAFPGSALRLDGLVRIGLPIASAMEGALFATFVTAALMLHDRVERAGR